MGKDRPLVVLSPLLTVPMIAEQIDEEQTEVGTDRLAEVLPAKAQFFSARSAGIRLRNAAECEKQKSINGLFPCCTAR